MDTNQRVLETWCEDGALCGITWLISLAVRDITDMFLCIFVRTYLKSQCDSVPT